MKLLFFISYLRISYISWPDSPQFFNLPWSNPLSLCIHLPLCLSFLIYIHQVQFALPTHSCTCSLLSVCGSLARSCTVKADLVRVSDSSFTASCKLLKLLWSSIYSSINKQHQTYLCMPAIWVLELQRQQPPEFKSCLDQTIQETLSQKQEGDTVLTCQIYYREL